MNDKEIANLVKTFRPSVLKEKVKFSERVKRHVTGGDGAMELIAKRQPNEPEEIFKYRKENFRLITRGCFYKVFGILSKINSASDFVITYPDVTRDPLGTTDDRLIDYCSKRYPGTGDIRLWLFQDGLHALLTEPNGVYAVLPSSWSWERVCAPVLRAYEAFRVIHLDENDAVIMLSDKYSPVDCEYLWITPSQICKVFVKSGAPKKLFLCENITGEIPVWTVGGFLDGLNGCCYRSFIDGCIDYWDETVVMESDLQGAIKQHVYPEAAVFSNMECPTCMGHGVYIPEGNRTKVKCDTCKGNGILTPSVYATHIVRPAKEGEQPAPFPSKVYITKDLASVSLLRDNIDRAIKLAYSAINFEFLAETPLAQAGVSKAYDRQEMNAFIGAVANHIVKNVLCKAYEYIVKYRYPIDNTAKINDILPVVTVPRQFDVLPPDFIISELQAARTAGADNALICGLMMQYSSKRFAGDQRLMRIENLSIAVDPLSGYSIDNKLAIRSAGAVSNANFVLSVNIFRLIVQAEADTPNFWHQNVASQKKILYDLALKESETVMNENTANILPDGT